jgi:hypothetical protein
MRRSAPATTLSERRSRASAARVSTARRCVVGIASRPRGGESGDRLVDACHLATIGRPGLALLLVVRGGSAARGRSRCWFCLDAVVVDLRSGWEALLLLPCCEAERGRIAQRAGEMCLYGPCTLGVRTIGSSAQAQDLCTPGPGDTAAPPGGDPGP